MHLLLAILLITVFSFSCKRQNSVPKKTIKSDPTQIVGDLSKATKVIGYRFAKPNSKGVLFNGAIDMEELKKFKKKQVSLSKSQISRLVDSVYGENPRFNPIACYEPHHIFIFQDDSDIIVNVIEICFGCNILHAYPEIESTYWQKHDFRDLARLCDEIGLGMTSGTAEDFIKFWDEQGEPRK